MKSMKSVAICGSKKFEPEIRKFAGELKKKGIVVYEPYLHEGGGKWDKLSQEYKNFVALGLTHDHLYKIRMADVVFVYNKDGYAGYSTTLEIGFAVALGKPIYALSDIDEDICRRVLFRKVIKTPEELIKELS